MPGRRLRWERVVQYWRILPAHCSTHSAAQAVQWAYKRGMRNPVHMRAAQRAADISGGLGPLGMYLKVSPFVVAGWIEGLEDVPAETLLKLVDIILRVERAGLGGPIAPWEADAFKHRLAANS